jgi:hypothetical protein
VTLPLIWLMGSSSLKQLGHSFVVKNRLLILGLSDEASRPVFDATLSLLFKANVSWNSEGTGAAH